MLMGDVLTVKRGLTVRKSSVGEGRSVKLNLGEATWLREEEWGAQDNRSFTSRNFESVIEGQGR